MKYILILFFITCSILSFGQIEVAIGDTIEMTKQVKQEYNFRETIEGKVIKIGKVKYLVISKVELDSEYVLLKKGERQQNVNSEYGNQFSEVYDANTIVYYGLDFSNFGLTNPAKVGQEEMITKYFTAWMSEVNSFLSVSKLKSSLRKKVETNLQPVQGRYKLIREEWISFGQHNFDTEKIKEIVKEYQLKKTAGVGFVLIVENFDKELDVVRVNYTFFDIATREVLYSMKIRGSARGAGMTNHWSRGILSSYYTFTSYYNMAIKKSKF
tara:strand:- start:1526 stop:2332 length:807 start_codon:yes stop_codon:yes gene_type:complete